MPRQSSMYQMDSTTILTKNQTLSPSLTLTPSNKASGLNKEKIETKHRKGFCRRFFGCCLPCCCSKAKTRTKQTNGKNNNNKEVRDHNIDPKAIPQESMENTGTNNKTQKQMKTNTGIKEKNSVFTRLFGPKQSKEVTKKKKTEFDQKETPIETNSTADSVKPKISLKELKNNKLTEVNDTEVRGHTIDPKAISQQSLENTGSNNTPKNELKPKTHIKEKSSFFGSLFGPKVSKESKNTNIDQKERPIENNLATDRVKPKISQKELKNKSTEVNTSLNSTNKVSETSKKLTEETNNKKKRKNKSINWKKKRMEVRFEEEKEFFIEKGFRTMDFNNEIRFVSNKSRSKQTIGTDSQQRIVSNRRLVSQPTRDDLKRPEVHKPLIRQSEEPLLLTNKVSQLRTPLGPSKGELPWWRRKKKKKIESKLWHWIQFTANKRHQALRTNVSDINGKQVKTCVVFNGNDFDWKAFAKDLNLETNHPLVVDNPSMIYSSIVRSVHTLAANNITLGQFLGVGGFGSVISGTKDGLELAIKFDFSSDEELVITKVSDMLDVTRVISHPNVIRFYSLGPRSAIFAMERAETDLYDYVRQHLMYDKEKAEIRIRTALDLFNQIIEGVAHIHRLGFAHQDLKPPNIVIIGDNSNNITRLTAKVTDFDTLLQCVDRSTGRPLPCYPFHATSIYAAPEVLASKYTIASYESSLRPIIADIRRQDVYSIGMTLVFMLSGYEPWIFDDQIEAEVDWRLDIMSRPQQMTDTISHFPYINGYDMGLKALLLDFLCPEPTTRITLETYRTNQRFAKFRDRLIGFKTYDRKELIRRPIQNFKVRKNWRQKLGFSRFDATFKVIKT